MENLFQIFIIVVVVIIALVKQFGKAAKQAKEEQVKMNIPEIYEEVENESYTPPTSYKKAKRKPVTKHSSSQSGIPTSPPIPEEPNADTEFDISSSEEIRRAIIWSEILNRKY